MMNATIIIINTCKKVVRESACEHTSVGGRHTFEKHTIWTVTDKHTEFLATAGIVKMKYLLLLFFLETWALASCVSVIPGVAVDDRNGVSLYFRSCFFVIRRSAFEIMKYK